MHKLTTMKYFNYIIILAVGISFFSCGTTNQETKSANTLFKELPASQTGVDFVNQLDYNAKFNIYTYRNFYNGGGVAIGDVNNDGLQDLYFTANMKQNRLYLNKGNFEFEDITETAKVGGERAWSTGVSITDVNGDGFLDIYVCNSGDIEGDNKQNELYINHGDLTFTESAEQYGLADQGFSTHAAFFDYDKDGDLDCYLLNNSYKAIGSFNLRKSERPKRDPVGGDKLLRNDGETFTDVSEEAGIYGSIIGFGLGVTVGDVNRDGWDDIYVSNDFFERDYLYINNQDGTFNEDLEGQMKSISGASMGADMADINNDGYADIFVTEMLPKDDARYKTNTTFESWDRYQYNVKNGYYHQFTRNMLQLNNGDDSFSEIGRLAGVEATDWSWGALIADYDNDGLKDIFVANGINQDLTNQDYIQFFSNEEMVKSIIAKESVDYQKLIDAIPTQMVKNYFFSNQGDLQFENKTDEVGLGTPSHSNGSAYVDLDNDGDLDIVVNNINMPAFIYQNQLEKLNPERNFIQFKLKGKDKNPFAIGTKITAKAGGKTFFVEMMPVRGFQSTVDSRPIIGLGDYKSVEELLIEWPDGTITKQTDVLANRLIELNWAEAVKESGEEKEAPVAQTIFEEVENTLPFEHVENDFIDFDRDRLIFHMVSREGPKITQGDVNGDGLTDIYMGGAKDSPGVLLVQQRNGQMKPTNQEVFEKDKTSEDTNAVFYDADGDGDQDLYVTSGGNEFPNSASALSDRLYFNDGRGNLTKSQQILPVSTRFEPTSTVKPADFDGDGDLDLFVGVRLKPFYYGMPVNGYLLENDGKGNYKNITIKVAPGLIESGLITDAIWEDLDGDNDPDLIVVGEWMPISVFENTLEGFKENTKSAGLAKSAGWWNTITAADLDNDGDTDFVVGNHGLNSRFSASETEPLCLHVNDFDKNGSVEQLLCVFNEGTSYPLALRHDLVKQLPGLKKKYLKYEDYKNQTVEDIFTADQRMGMKRFDVYSLETSVLLNNGDGTFQQKALPVEAQLSPTYGILIKDVDGDNNLDILLGGNFYAAKPEVGRYDASYGTLLKGDGKGDFVAVDNEKAGIRFEGEVRDIEEVTMGGKNFIVVSRNNDTPQVFKLKE